MIRVTGISKRYGSVRALETVSFEAVSEKPVVIVGNSGSGKTTLLRLIAGLELPDQGEIHINGRLASSNSWVMPPHLRDIGFVFQTPALWPHLTLAQNIRFAVRGASAREARHRVDDLIEHMELAGLGGRYPNQVSGGEARRTALARALAGRPGNLLLDEPLTNLDPSLKAKMIELLQRVIAGSCATLLYVTHDRAEADRISDQHLLLERGCLFT